MYYRYWFIRQRIASIPLQHYDLLQWNGWRSSIRILPWQRPGPWPPSCRMHFPYIFRQDDKALISKSKAPRRDAPPLAIKSFTFCLPNHIQYEFNPLQLQQNSITITVILSATIPSSILITSKLHPTSPKFSPGLLCAKNRVIKQELPQNGFLIQDVGTGL